YEFIGWQNAAAQTELYADEAPVPAAWFVTDGQTVTLTALWLSLSVEAAAGSGYLPLLKVGDTGTLEAALDVTGGLATDITWSTSDPAKVSVAAQGASCTLTAAASGTATITATVTVAEIPALSKTATFQARAFDAAAAMATSTNGTRTFIRVDSGDTAGYHEIHTFTANGSLNVTRPAAAGKTWLLLVAGGGGGGGATYPGGGGGAGGYGEDDAYTLPAGTYTVTIGTFGAAGNQGSNGGNGGDSSLAGGGITTIQVKGGGGGAFRSGPNQNRNGNAGGSCGGNAGYIASRPVPSAGSGLAPEKFFGNAGGSGNSGQAGDVGDYCGGGGGAGGPGTFTWASNGGGYTRGQGPGKKSWISGAEVTYAEGGPLSSDVGSNNVSWVPTRYGSGGQGGWNGAGGKGKSGIVIVRFAFVPAP
ncbi:MAG: Ig-like domain-containing protein, partial [Spirochaetaceae bacterium]|nr:Ig-like domain-containing protein [Spirochaetaceae bacterium]